MAKTLTESLQTYRDVLESGDQGFDGIDSPLSQSTELMKEPGAAKKELEEIIKNMESFHKSMHEISVSGSKLNAAKVAARLDAILESLASLKGKL